MILDQLPMSTITIIASTCRDWSTGTRSYLGWQRATRCAKMDVPTGLSYVSITCRHSMFICDRCCGYTCGRKGHADVPVPVNISGSIWRICLQCRIEHYDKYPQSLHGVGITMSESYAMSTYCLEDKDFAGLTKRCSETHHSNYPQPRFLLDSMEVIKQALKIHGGWCGIQAAQRNVLKLKFQQLDQCISIINKKHQPSTKSQDGQVKKKIKRHHSQDARFHHTYRTTLHNMYQYNLHCAEGDDDQSSERNEEYDLTRDSWAEDQELDEISLHQEYANSNYESFNNAAGHGHFDDNDASSMISGDQTVLDFYDSLDESIKDGVASVYAGSIPATSKDGLEDEIEDSKHSETFSLNFGGESLAKALDDWHWAEVIEESAYDYDDETFSRLETKEGDTGYSDNGINRVYESDSLKRLEDDLSLFWNDDNENDEEDVDMEGSFNSDTSTWSSDGAEEEDDTELDPGFVRAVENRYGCHAVVIE
ncbi:hypothetical protein BG006_007878 [Podila minutissima]|uniref:Uncharacterized protein n=1 Tax=Podila minutissima TaxID=64525 RepID=A0A9P5SGR2_9FUNG|nr:hypothetical protein BG006_007878 [Podila minutissima]